MNGWALRIITLLSLSATASASENVETSWRLQGPAFSYHFSKVGAPFRGTTTKNDGSNPVGTPHYSFGSTIVNANSPTETAKSFCDRYTIAVANELKDKPTDPRITSLSSECRANLYKAVTEPKRQWNQTNLELGLEFTERDLSRRSVTKYFAGSVVDSNYKVGAYMGASRQFPWLDGSRFRIDAGAMSMLWYRSVADADGALKRRVVPVVMPVLSIEDKRSGMGANLSFAPQIAFNHRRYSVNTLMLQLTWAIKNGEQGN